MADTFSALTDRVRAFLVDQDGTFVTDANIATWLNEAYFDLASRLEAVEEEFDATTSGSTIALPPSGSGVIGRVASLRIDDEDVSFVDDATWNSYEATTTDPGFTIARVFANTIELYPTPDSGLNYVLRCLVIPEAMAGSDVHQLPIWVERKLVDWATYRAWMKGDEITRAREFLSLYLEGLPDPSYGKDRSIPGPLTLAPSVGPFDLDIDAAHI